MDLYATIRDATLDFVKTRVCECDCLADTLRWVFVIAALYGLFCTVRFILFAVRAVFTSLLRSGGNVRKYGEWAIVTGATDGIGKGYATELARKGMNVVLISRTQSKLDDVATSIKKDYPKAEVKTVAVDFTQFDDAAKQRVADCIKDMDVGVLVNNVGTAYSFPQFFHEVDLATSERLVDLNIKSVIGMTHMVLPGMMERHRGAILNLSSGTSLVPGALQSVYGGTKNWVNAFTEAIALEYRAKGIFVQCVQPMFVATKLAKIRRPSLFAPSARTFARASIANIGFETTTIPYVPHSLQMWVGQSLPRWVLGSYIFSLHAGLRKRALKKLAKQQ